MAEKTVTVAELAKASGLGRTYVYYLVKVGVLKPIGPKGTTVRFDEAAVQVATVFARLQKQRGLRPRDLLGLVGAALATYMKRVAFEQIRPREEDLERVNEEIVELIIASIADLEFLASAKSPLTPEARTRIARLLDKGRRAKWISRELTNYRYDLYKIPEDDPAWDVLDPLFKTRRERNDFLRLLNRARVLPEIIERSKAIKSGEAKR